MRHQAGDDLPAMTAVIFEIRIGSEYQGIGKSLGHANEASIGEAHGEVRVFGSEVEHVVQFIRES
jgi:hypothetical protein